MIGDPCRVRLPVRVKAKRRQAARLFRQRCSMVEVAGFSFPPTMAVSGEDLVVLASLLNHVQHKRVVSITDSETDALHRLEDAGLVARCERGFKLNCRMEIGVDRRTGKIASWSSTKKGKRA